MATGNLHIDSFYLHLHLFSLNMWENRKQIKMTVEQDNKVL